jgi:hypothetical protein
VAEVALVAVVAVVALVAVAAFPPIERPLAVPVIPVPGPENCVFAVIVVPVTASAETAPIGVLLIVLLVIVAEVMDLLVRVPGKSLLTKERNVGSASTPDVGPARTVLAAWGTSTSMFAHKYSA